MAYSDDAVRAKLSSLNETQDSIVTVAQWIMFHRRHADRTVQLWLTRLQDSATPKRLNLVYLANEVVQQSRARSKTDFLIAFEPLISDATSIAYKGASVEVQNKLKRVVEVWRQRQIFDLNIQSAIEKRLEEIDRARGGNRANGIGGTGKLGGSLFAGSGGPVPAELDSVAKASNATSKAEIGSKSTVATAEMEYEKMMDPETPLPTPPVHAARLSALMKNLASAQGAVESCIKARREMIVGLEKLLEIHKNKMAAEESQGKSLRTRRDAIEEKKREVEDGIMRGLTTPDSGTPPLGAGFGSSATTNANESSSEPTRPEPESFTPPPPDVEGFTPPPQPAADAADDTFAIGDANARERLLADTAGAETMIQEQPTDFNETPPKFEPPPALQIGQVRQASGELPFSTSGDPRLKRRKMAHSNQAKALDDEIFGSAAVGVDEEGITALLGN